ncbi:aldose epimerase family protein [Nitriliruptor alkaliphilus]|uniref:aldose epimerase family protein n=1 Tax=Nitriliruptor alkaliphilus TaxID=427918 RepID=UPI000698AFA4|nr:aldose epimerase family protein [Nitriliruptor alkaliphilus]
MFGTTPAGDAARLIAIEGAGGRLATVTDLGATLVGLHAPDRDGHLADVILGYSSAEAYAAPDNPFLGATIGRVAGRIASGTFTIDGRQHTLARNEGPHHLHGGAERPFHRVLWTVEHADRQEVCLRHVSPDGEEGYPGELDATATYRWLEDTLEVTYRATTDATTPVSMTNHAYVNLAGAGSGTVRDHELRIVADRVLEVTDELIPTGTHQPVEGTVLDLRRPTVIGAGLDELRDVPRAHGYDHSYLLDGPGAGVRLAAVLRDPRSGRVLELSTDQPCLQFYSGNQIAALLEGKDGRRYGVHAGLCLEPQQLPDAVNQPTFPTVLVGPDEAYEHVSRYRYTTDRSGASGR